ncbi:MAG: DNA polymerase III subunit beta [Planctomycetota bacterium]
MKLTCEREKLLHAFQTAASVAPSRSPKPVLSNVKLEASAEAVTLLGTDLEMGIRVDVAGIEVEAPGAVLLPIDRVGAVLRESSDEKLLLESDGRKTLIRGQWAEFQLPSENPDEFPQVAGFSENAYHELSARFFRELVRRTVFATDPENSRYALGGVLVEFSEEDVVAIGTDGRRLAKQEGPAKSVGGHSTTGRQTIVPTRAMTVIERATGDNEEQILLAARDNDIIVRSGRTTVYSRLVEGRYPKWRDVFPRGDEGIEIEATVGPFYSALRQAAIVATGERRAIEFRFGEGKVMMAGHGAEQGESHVELPIAYDGATVPVSLDWRFFGEFLRVLDSEAVIKLRIRDSESAVVCSTSDGYAYVIMPLARDHGA